MRRKQIFIRLLMTGVYTDNQPDFTWLKPFEEKKFQQYFMPYKAIGQVSNATKEAAVHLSCAGEKATIAVYATSVQEKAIVVLEAAGKEVLREQTRLSPLNVYMRTIPIGERMEEELGLAVYAENGTCLVRYCPEKSAISKLPEPAEAAKEPEEICSNEELYLTGLHLEQYRHATYLPDPYYLEGLKRDPGDIRINNAYGLLLMRRGRPADAEAYFRKALERLIKRNPNPYNSETYYLLGLDLFLLKREAEAYDAFYKATWSSEQQEMSFYYLAVLDARAGHIEKALTHIEQSLIKNTHNVKARALKAYLLRRSGRSEEAAAWISENKQLDPFDFVSCVEEVRLAGENEREALQKVLRAKMRGFAENYRQAAGDYAEFGAYPEAIELLRQGGGDGPMSLYAQAYYQNCLEQAEGSHAAVLSKEVTGLLRRAEQACPDYCFPNKMEDIAVLQFAVENGCFSRAAYYLGNLFYDKLQWKQAIALWEKAAQADGGFPTVWRNLALAYYNKKHDAGAARKALECAFRLNPMDARVFLELDQLHKKLGDSFEQRLAACETHRDLVESRDDLFVEYVTLVNLSGDHERAYRLLMGRHFHPWEGGEGKVTAQYTLALYEMARKALREKRYVKAETWLREALVYPENLGEGKLEGTKDNHIYYSLGLALEAQGKNAEAKSCFERATVGTDEPAGAMYYNDQPADMILYQGLAFRKLGKTKEANARFYRLIDYGEQHLEDSVKMDYFAVSLPDFQIFEEDYTAKNRAHCWYLLALGNIGLGNRSQAAVFLREAEKAEPSHMMCRVYRDRLDWRDNGQETDRGMCGCGEYSAGKEVAPDAADGSAAALGVQRGRLF